jgi:hypothetical protein
LIAILLYLLSLLIQFYIWVRALSSYHQISWQDAVIYFRTLLMRRLPGGVWQWVGRTAMYTSSTELPPRIALIANFWEWAMLVLLAAGIACAGWREAPLVFRWIAAPAFLLLATGLGWIWGSKNRPASIRLAESISWVLLYGVSWSLGGAIVYDYVQAAGGDAITWGEATWVWSLTGGASFLLVVLSPAGLGIREITLTWLLKPYLTIADSLLVSLFIRIIFTLADVIWGLLGWGLSYLILAKKGGQKG